MLFKKQIPFPKVIWFLSLTFLCGIKKYFHIGVTPAIGYNKKPWTLLPPKHMNSPKIQINSLCEKYKSYLKNFCILEVHKTDSLRLVEDSGQPLPRVPTSSKGRDSMVISIIQGQGLNLHTQHPTSLKDEFVSHQSSPSDRSFPMLNTEQVD